MRQSCHGLFARKSVYGFPISTGKFLNTEVFIANSIIFVQVVCNLIGRSRDCAYESRKYSARDTLINRGFCHGACYEMSEEGHDSREEH